MCRRGYGKTAVFPQSLYSPTQTTTALLLHADTCGKIDYKRKDHFREKKID